MFRSNLKKIILVAGLLFAAGRVHATDVAYSGIFQGTEGPATKTGQTASATYTRDMNTTGNLVSFQVVYSSFSGNGTTSKTFTDGSASTGSFTVASPSGAQAGTSITINGITVPYNFDATYSSNTAVNICSSMTATTAMQAIVHCQAIGSVVTSTATAVGLAVNYTMSSSTTGVTTSGATMTGGTNSAYLINTPTITISGNGFTTGLQVLYTKAAGQDITGLTDQTTYYVSVVNPNTLGLANTFKLSTTLVNAQAGTGIVLASSAVKTTADTFTLAPLTFTNSTGGIQLQWSDDNAHWTNVTTGNYGLALTSVTFSSGGGVSLWDLGVISHRYLRASETPPPTGGATYTMTDNERYTMSGH